MKKYKILNNIIFIFHNTWKNDKPIIGFCFLQIPTIIFTPLLITYLSKYIVQFVSEKKEIFHLISYIFAISIGILIISLFNHYSSAKIQWRSFGCRFSFITMVAHKSMDADYCNMEDAEGQIKMQKAIDSLYNNNSGIQQIFAQIVNMISNMVGLIIYSFLIITLNIWIFVGLVVLSLISYFIQKQHNNWIYKNRNNWVAIDRKLNYITQKSGDYSMAKDIRLFSMSKWLENMYDSFFIDRKICHQKSERYNFSLNLITLLITFLREGGVYIFLIYMAIHSNMSIANFVLYFGLISSYSNWMVGLIDSVIALHSSSLNICDVREFLDLPDYFNKGKGVSLPIDACEITFENVCFSYPDSEHLILNNINFTIKKGEKVALVGLNGAGKTTLIKLLCGLYIPKSGYIKINGENMQKYNRDEYYSLISAVFQDIYLLPLSIEKNIALSEESQIDNQRIAVVLEQAGLLDKVMSLPRKEKTLLLKGIDDDAIDLSGGEKQKLALARALYKGGKILILDEPTASLDPIAEGKIYKKYNEIAIKKTAVFVSHRLASTAFCDRILFLEDGKIVEEGSHSELMNKKTKYFDLFSIQRKYYQESSDDNE